MSSRRDLNKIGKYIYELRKKKGYTQKALGEIIDISDKTISKWEQGAIAPDITVLAQLAEALDTTVDDIINCGYIENKERINKRNNLRLIKLLIIIIVFLSVTVEFTIRSQNYFRTNYRAIRVQEDFKITGFIVTNNYKSTLVINNIYFNNQKDNQKITNVRIAILNNDEIIFKNVYILDEYLNINEFFQKFFVSINVKEKSDVEFYKIHINYQDESKEIYEYEYNL